MAKIPVDNKDEYREAAVPVEFWKECMATDLSSTTRKPPSLRRAERRAGGFVLSDHRAAAVEGVEYLCTDAGHRSGSTLDRFPRTVRG